MAIDPNIPLMGRQFQQPTQTQLNPLEMMSTFANIQGRQLGNEQAARELAAKQRAAEILANAPDKDSAVAAMLKDPVVGAAGQAGLDYIKGYGDLMNTFASQRLKEVQTQREVQGRNKDAFASVAQNTASALSEDTPEAAIKTAKEKSDAYLQSLDPETRKAMTPVMNDFQSSIFVPGTSLLDMQHKFIARLSGAGVAPQQLAGMLPQTNQTQTFGNQTQYGQVEGGLLGGGNANKFTPSTPAMLGGVAPSFTSSPTNALLQGIPAVPAGGVGLGGGVGATAQPQTPAQTQAPALGIPQIPQDGAQVQPAAAPSPTSNTQGLGVPPSTGQGTSQPSAQAQQPSANAQPAEAPRIVKFDPAIDKPPPPIKNDGTPESASALNQRQALDAQTMKDFNSPEETERYNANKDSMSQLQQIMISLNKMGSDGFLAPGFGGRLRLDAARATDAMLKVFGSGLDKDSQQKIAEGIKSEKMNGQLALSLVKSQTRGAEAASTLERGFQQVPGIENTNLANPMVTASLWATQQRANDLHDFKQDFLNTYHTLVGSDKAFADHPGNSIDDYTDEALKPFGLAHNGFVNAQAIFDNVKKGLLTPQQGADFIKANPKIKAEADELIKARKAGAQAPQSE